MGDRNEANPPRKNSLCTPREGTTPARTAVRRQPVESTTRGACHEKVMEKGKEKVDEEVDGKVDEEASKDAESLATHPTGRLERDASGRARAHSKKNAPACTKASAHSRGRNLVSGFEAFARGVERVRERRARRGYEGR